MVACVDGQPEINWHVQLIRRIELAFPLRLLNTLQRDLIQIEGNLHRVNGDARCQQRSPRRSAGDQISGVNQPIADTSGNRAAD